MKEKQYLFIAENKEDLKYKVRELLFSKEDEQIQRKYNELSPLKQLFIQATIRRLIGHDHVGFNLEIIGKCIYEAKEISERNWAKHITATNNNLEFKDFDNLKSDETDQYRNKLRILNRSGFHRKDSRNYIETYCDCLLISPYLLYLGEGKSYDFDMPDLENKDFDEFLDNSQNTSLKSTKKILTEYEYYLKQKKEKIMKKVKQTHINSFVEFLDNYLEPNIIKQGEYIKIAQNNSYSLLKKKKYGGIKEYIDYLILDLIDKMDINEDDIDNLDINEDDIDRLL